MLIYILKSSALLLICISLHCSTNIRCIDDVSCQFLLVPTGKSSNTTSNRKLLCEKSELSEMNDCECSYFVDSAYYIR
jgi:ATP-dependent phosphoenolpyruvate carboxykinase